MANRPSRKIDDLINQLKDIKSGISANISEWTPGDETLVNGVFTSLDDMKAELETANAVYNDKRQTIENYISSTANKTYAKYRDLAYGKYGRKNEKLTEFGIEPLPHATVTPDAPHIPLHIKAVLSDDRAYITLSWDKPKRAKSYEIWYGSSTDIKEDRLPPKVFLSSCNVTTFKHAELVRGTKYFYWLKAKGSTGDSDFSAPITCVAV